MTFDKPYMTYKWCSVNASSANGLICGRNESAKLLRGVHRLMFFGSENEPVRVSGRKSRTSTFLPRTTVAGLPARAKTLCSVEAAEKTERYLSHTQSWLFRALRQGKLWRRAKKLIATFLTHRAACFVRWEQGKLWSCIRNLAPTFLLTDESVCTAGLLRPSFIRYIRFVKGQKWIILNTFIVFNIVNKMVLKKHQISEYKAMFFNKFFTMHLDNLQSTDFSTDVSPWMLGLNSIHFR